jgi:hypothetical protein
MRGAEGAWHQFLGCSLLLTLILALFPALNGNAEQQAPKASKSAKPQKKKAAPAVKPVLEPKALDIVKAASDRLAAARTLSFTAVATHETPSRPGPPLLNTLKGEVILQRPDKMRVITPGDGRAFEFYYNGKTVMAYAPVENLVAVADAPPSIDAMLDEVHRLAAVSFPFADLISDNPYQQVAPGLKLAFYVGQSHIVGDTTTDIVALENDKAFAQLWIGTEDHLPRMIRLVYLDDPQALRVQVQYYNWELDRTFPADAFESAKASSAPHIPFSRPDLLKPLPGPKPAAKKGKPAKTKGKGANRP